MLGSTSFISGVWSMRPLVRALSISFVFILSATGCDCRGNSGVGQGLAELGVVWKDGTGAERVDRDATYDFGAALVGERIVQQMVVRNLGRGQLKLITLEQTDGATTSIGADGKTDAYFEVKFTPPISI